MGKAASRSSPDLTDPSARTQRALGRDDNSGGSARQERNRVRAGCIPPLQIHQLSDHPVGAAYMPPVFNPWRQAAERRQIFSLGREPQEPEEHKDD